MVAKLILQNTIYILVMGALLLGSAGTWHWPAAWLFLVISAIVGPIAGLWLARTNPDLLRERLRPVIQREQPGADKLFIVVLLLVIVGWFVAMGFEQRWHRTGFPIGVQMLGIALYLASTLLCLWVFRENAFAAPVVKVQAEHHRVISTGPYAFVRHPMYGAVVLFFLGIPLLLGSWWGLAMVPLFIVLFAIRTRIEESALTQALPGYADYAARVRYRLVPGLW